MRDLLTKAARHLVHWIMALFVFALFFPYPLNNPGKHTVARQSGREKSTLAL